MVKKNIVNFGEVGPNEIIEIRWDLTVDPSEIVHMQPDCGCTANPHVDRENNQIVATYTEDSAKELSDVQKKDWYPDGKIPISKSMTVYLRDEHSLIVLDENDQTTFNPAKRTEKIGFAGYCNYKAPVEAQT